MPPAISPRSQDTTIEAEEVQLALIRAASVARRLHLAFGLSATAINLARRALARAYPSATRDELDVHFVAAHYGADLASELRVELDRRHRERRAG